MIQNTRVELTSDVRVVEPMQVDVLWCPADFTIPEDGNVKYCRVVVRWEPSKKRGPQLDLEAIEFCRRAEQSEKRRA